MKLRHQWDQKLYDIVTFRASSDDLQRYDVFALPAPHTCGSVKGTYRWDGTPACRRCGGSLPAKRAA